MAHGSDRSFRIWLLPFSLLFTGAVTVFVLCFWVDSGGVLSKLSLLARPNPEAAAMTMSNAGEIVAAVLGIAITVVAIIVELASNRYTHRVTELFVSEPVNFFVMGFFVITALQAIAVTLVFDDGPGGSGFVPYLGVTVSMAMLATCLLLLLPYFAFVFDFLNPIQIVDRIRRHTLKVVSSKREMPVKARQAEAVRGVEQLADVGLNAMEHKDKGVSMASVNALMKMVIEYQPVREGLAKEWFRVDGALAQNPDFVSMSDINYLIAINTRHIAEEAIRVGNDELFALVVKFFNTYLRATVNARDVRTAYNILHQYRLLAEGVLHHKGGTQSIEIARYFKYYGLTSFGAKLPFLLETVAYDLCELNEIAFNEKSDASRELLRIFLEVDKESEGDVQEVSLRGVRKAQLKLATHYLVHDAEHLAREIFHDMEGGRRDRLASIRDELLNVSTGEFWEISDRGVNFDFLTPDRKEALKVFFAWFGDLPRESHMTSLRPNASETKVASAASASDASELLGGPGVGRDPKND